MKRLILLMLLLSALFETSLNAQDLKHESAFYKTVAKGLTALNSFDEVNEGRLARDSAIDQIKKNLIVIDSEYELLRKGFSNDEDFEVYELWVLTIRKSLMMLEENDPMFALGSALLKMDIYDFMNSKY